MEMFSYTVTDPIGIHARPAGLLAKLCGGMTGTTVTVEKDGKSAECVRLMAVMGLGIKCGDTVTFTLAGGDEKKNAEALRAYCEKNL